MCLKWVLFGILLVILSTSASVTQLDDNVRNTTSTSSVSITTNDVVILVNDKRNIDIFLTGYLDETVNVTFDIQHDQVIAIDPKSIEFYNSTWVVEQNRTISILGRVAGHTEVTAKATPSQSLNVSGIFLRVTVANSLPLITVSSLVGWLYFAAWSISFYPQIISNCQRKSVVGLNFDFVALNIVGFTLYSLFNVGLYWNSYIEQEYFNRFPHGLNPVQLNDVFFSMHAMFATSIIIIQCFIFERAEQRVSYTARILLAVLFVCVILFGGLVQYKKIHWLDFLYYCSYIKLFITLIKYMPQAYMNYRRKSTSGWSIGNVLLDFAGGWLSILQMLFNAYNYNDWDSIFGDPTKFGLGLFSVLFDILFFVQHYVLYRGSSSETYADIAGDNMARSPTQSTVNTAYSSDTIA